MFRSVGGGPQWRWGRTSMAVEAHAEEEWARDVNLDNGRAGGVDLDGGRAVEAHAEEE
jgi:hypothetical protein